YHTSKIVKLAPGARDFAGEELAHALFGDIAGDEGLADAAHENERELGAAYLLVLGHEAHERLHVRLRTGNVGDTSRQPDGLEMGANALARTRRAEPERLREPECARHADGDRLAVQQPVRVAAPGPEPVPEAGAEVEQR